MFTERSFQHQQEEDQFKTALAQALMNGTFEVIPTNNIESRNWNVMMTGVFRDMETTEYFELRSTYGSRNGQWQKVRHFIDDHRSKIFSTYTFRTVLGGNTGMLGRVDLELEIQSDEGDLELSVAYDPAIQGRYLKSSVDFGIFHAFEDLGMFGPMKGRYKVTVKNIGFHEIDSDTTTIAYAANMAIKRAFDQELKGNSFKYNIGKFELHKKYPIKNSLKV